MQLPVITSKLAITYVPNIQQWSKVDSHEEKPRPVRRVLHSAVCLGQGGDHPQLLITGGIDDNEDTLGDLWLLDLGSGRWREVRARIMG